jgi:hypothetical protein
MTPQTPACWGTAPNPHLTQDFNYMLSKIQILYCTLSQAVPDDGGTEMLKPSGDQIRLNSTELSSTDPNTPSANA